MPVKQTVQKVLPDGVLTRIRSMRESATTRRDARRSPEEVFSDIYKRGTWGGPKGGVWSGSGSHEPAVIDPYVAAVRRRLSKLRPQHQWTLVDLGCGDFSVGSQIYQPGDRFLACDLVPRVIEANRARYSSLDVDFLTLNMITDPLPSGDVAFVRQVLQHLSNRQVAQILPKLQDYSTVFITEHYPSDEDFTAANLDKTHGGGTRVVHGSAVYLTEAPFSLPDDQVHLLVEVPAPALVDGQKPGWIRTFEYSPRANH